MTNTEYVTKNRSARHAKGLCVACGKHPHLWDRKRCRPCLDRQTNYGNNWRERQQKKEGRSAEEY